MFDDVRRKVFIRKQLLQGEVKNELDIALTRNGRLVVCSCKSFSTLQPDKIKNTLLDAIYELASLSRREAAGIYCGKVLVTNYPDPGEAIRQRARDTGVRLVCDTEIKNIALQLKFATGC